MHSAPLSEVQKSLPGAKAGQFNRALADPGIAECDYDNPGGKVLSVMETYESDSSTAKQEVLDWAETMNTDPSNPFKRNSLKIDPYVRFRGCDNANRVFGVSAAKKQKRGLRFRIPIKWVHYRHSAL